LDGHDIQNNGFLSDLLHERSELVVNASELVELCGEHRLDICTSKEYSFEVDVSSLDIDPSVKGNSDFLKLVVPRHNLFLEHFVVGRHFHRGYIVDVLINLGEEVIPAFDQPTFVLISDELKLVFGPTVLDASDELLEDQLAPRLIQDSCHDLVVLDKISLPEIVENQVIEFDFDFQLGQ